jgi:hypothetical protein
MPDKKEGGKALNGIVRNYELRKVKVGKKKRGSADGISTSAGVQIPPVLCETKL